MNNGNRKAILAIGTVMPALSGQGSHMRFGLTIEALSRIFDVTLAVAQKVPRDSLSVVPEHFRGLCAQVVVEGIGPGERSLRQRIESLPRPLPLAARMLVPVSMEMTDYPDQLVDRLACALAGQRFDAIHVFRLRAAPIARAIAARLAVVPEIRTLDLDDIESQAARRHADLHREHLGRIAYLGARIEAAKLAHEEVRAGHWFSQMLVCSNVDRQVLAARIGLAKAAVLPNGIRIPPPLSPPTHRPHKTLLFVGSLDYPPNIDAVEFLLREILPHLRSLWTGSLAVRIVGRRPGEHLRRLARESNAELHADAPSIEPYYADADVVVAPIRTGGGTRIKILEAFAFARPVVSTTIGAEGLEVEHGRDLLIADDPKAFASACAELLGSTERGSNLATHASQLVRNTYSPEAIARVMEELYRHLGITLRSAP